MLGYHWNPATKNLNDDWNDAADCPAPVLPRHLEHAMANVRAEPDDKLTPAAAADWATLKKAQLEAAGKGQTQPVTVRFDAVTDVPNFIVTLVRLAIEYEAECLERIPHAVVHVPENICRLIQTLLQMVTPAKPCAVTSLSQIERFLMLVCLRADI